MKKIMKKVLFIAVVVLLGLGNLSAQKTTYGVTAGFHSLDISVSVDGLTVSTSGSGYFVGFFADFNVSDNFNIQSEIHFASAYQDGDAANEIIIPVMVKYYVSEKFNIQAGPQFDFIVDESENVNKFGVGLGFGAGYDISEKIFAATRYTLGLSNRIQDGPSGMSAKFNTFQIGLGYRF
jgi:opacity protein-like surface antigen